MHVEQAKPTDLITNWLISSGIQCTNESSSLQGGVHSWFNPNNPGYPYIYTEITGYAITAYCYLANYQAAEKAAQWVINNAIHKCGGIKSRYFYKEPPQDYDWENGIIYAFDTGMALFGLTSLYKQTLNTKYIEAAKQLGNFLVAMQQNTGAFNAYHDPVTNQKIDIPNKWSTQSGAYHAKLALGLTDLYFITKQTRYKRTAENACNTALNYQRANGRFITFKVEKDTHLHPHCYACEGLLYTGRKLNRQDYIEAAKKGSKWLLETQLESGGIPSMYYNDGNYCGRYERSDILAQTLRLGVLTLEDEYFPKLEKLKNRLLEFLIVSDDKRAHGSIRYGQDEQGNEYQHSNSWCSMFALQALKMYENRVEGKESSIDYLI